MVQYFQYINTEIGSPPNLEVAKKLSRKLKIRIIIRGPDLRWSSDGVFPPPKSHIRFRPPLNGDRRLQSGLYKRQFVVRIPNPPYLTTFFTKNDSKLPSPWKFLMNTLLGILFVLVVLYFFLRRMISPLKTFQQGVKRLGAGELDHRISLNSKDELGGLSHEIDAMADDIQNMLEAKRQLLLSISHELRSPITRAKVATSLMEDDKLKDSLESDLNEMETMVAGLLEAERLNNRHQTLQLSKIAINPLIAKVISNHFAEAPIKFMADTKLEKQSIDEARFEFIIKNLIENALKHRKQDSDEISISSHIDKHSWQIIVEDHGVGISKTHLAHLTEPFYRVDPSRQRETGGYGLGLYIIKKIVEAHQGELLIESEEGLGTKVIVKMAL
jgi:signal transduction histidine kinase